MNHTHFTYVTTMPVPGSHTPECLFSLLEKLDLIERHQILEPLYSKYTDKQVREECPTDNGGMERTYENFKANLISLFDQLERREGFIYGLVCYLLLRAFLKSQGQDTLTWVHRRQETIEEPIAGIEDIPKTPEIEAAKEAYAGFCDLVVKPLLEESEGV